jgi:hypothetical protein
MHAVRNFPVLVFLLSFLVLWLSTQFGVLLRNKTRPLNEDEHEDFNTVLVATLTLLGLLIGFTFSMAISRYDQRKNYEAEEANAIGTEYVRAGLLPDMEAARVQQLLAEYLHERVLFYETRSFREDALTQIGIRTDRLETELWSAVRGAAAKQPTPPMALVVMGMNDVLNARAYTQAAWWNRIPVSAWTLMVLIAISCNFLLGCVSHRSRILLFIVLPLVLSISLCLLADIDSPRGGLIRVLPVNLLTLSQSIHSSR